MQTGFQLGAVGADPLPRRAHARCRGGRQAGAGTIATWARSAPSAQLLDSGRWLLRNTHSLPAASGAKFEQSSSYCCDGLYKSGKRSAQRRMRGGARREASGSTNLRWKPAGRGETGRRPGSMRSTTARPRRGSFQARDCVAFPN